MILQFGVGVLKKIRSHDAKPLAEVVDGIGV